MIEMIEVKFKLTEEQFALANHYLSVMFGRDSGSVSIPDAAKCLVLDKVQELAAEDAQRALERI